MPEEEDAGIMTPYEDYSVDELKEEFKRLFFLSDLNNADLAEMDHILDILREKEPLPPHRSVDELWEEFQSIYMKEPGVIGIHNNSDSEEVSVTEPALDVVSVVSSDEHVHPARPKRHRKLIRVALIAAALVVLMLAASATAAAMGFNLWGWLPIWGNEDVRFVSETPAQEPGEDDAQNIPMVLASLGITEPLYPTWLPEDLKRVSVKIVEDPLFLLENYQGNDRELSITISPTYGSETAIYQKEEVAPLEHIAGNSVHYIFDNTNEITAAWYTENYTTVIISNLSLDEIKRVIDSVYEVKK